MTDQPIALDQRRGMAAQKATEDRRLLADVAANEKALHERQENLEAQLAAAPAATWLEAAEKASYLLALFASAPIAHDPRRQKLIANVLEDLARLSSAETGHQLKPGMRLRSESQEGDGHGERPNQKQSGEEKTEGRKTEGAGADLPVCARADKG